MSIDLPVYIGEGLAAIALATTSLLDTSLPAFTSTVGPMAFFALVDRPVKDLLIKDLLPMAISNFLVSQM